MKQRIIAFLLAFALLSLNVPTIFAEDEEKGTEQNPIIIKTWDEFENYVSENSSGNVIYYSLGEDILYTGSEAVGGFLLTDTVIDGNGHKISGVKLKSALFSTVQNSAIRNVVFDNITFSSSEQQSDISILANYIDYSSYITSCAFSNCVLNLPNTCENVTAGIVVAQNEGVITNCILDESCEIVHIDGSCDDSTHYLGGITGINLYGLIVNSISRVKFNLSQGKNYVLGGITAENQFIVEYCYSEVEKPNVEAVFDALAGETVYDSEIIDCIYLSEGEYIPVGFNTNKNYNSMNIELLAAELTENVQNGYNQNYDFSSFSSNDIACPWTVEKGKLTLSFDGMTAWVYVYLDTTLENGELIFQEEMGMRVSEEKQSPIKYALKVGSFDKGEYKRNSFQIRFDTTRYMMVNNFVYSPTNSYVKSIQNKADGLETNYTQMYLASVPTIVSDGERENYVKNTSKGNVYPFVTELSLTNIKIKDELISLKFDGEGTEKSPFQIKNAFDLETLAKYVERGEVFDDIPYNEAYYSVMNDIDLTGFSFGSIGSVGNDNKNAFRGVFDGKGYTISNYTIETTRSIQGLFGLVAGYPEEEKTKGKKAVVKNVILENVCVKGERNSYGDLRGALIGQAEYALVSGCFVENTNAFMEGGTQIGGLIGYAYYCNIINCGASTKIVTHSGVAYTGGIVGNVAHSEIKNCYANTNFVINNIVDKRYMCIGPVAGYIRDTNFDNNFYIDNPELNYGKVKGVNRTILTTMQSENFSAELTLYSERNGFGNVFKNKKEGSKLPIPSPTDSPKAEYLVRCIPTDLGTIALTDGASSSLYPSGRKIEVTKSSGNDTLKGILITDLNGVKQDIYIQEEIAGEKYSFVVPNNPIYVVPEFSDVYLKGNGDMFYPYEITTFEEFNYMASKINSGNNAKNYNNIVYRSADYNLLTDIDFKGQEFEGIGTSTETFRGYFYGNGHTISNAKFKKALFNYISGDFCVEGIELKNITVTETEGALFVYDGRKGTFLTLNNVMATDCDFTGQHGSGLVYYGGEYGTYIYGFRMKNITYSGGGHTSALVKNTDYTIEAFYGVLINSSASYLCCSLFDGSSYVFAYSYTYNTTFNKLYNTVNSYTELTEEGLRDKKLIASLSASKRDGYKSIGWCQSVVDGYATMAVFEDQKAYYQISYARELTENSLNYIDMSSAVYGAKENESIIIRFNPEMYTGDLKISDSNGNDILYTMKAPMENETYGYISFIMPENDVTISNSGKPVKYYGLSGAGTESSPYIISTPKQLKTVADIINGTEDISLYYYTTEYNSAHFILQNDLDMNGIDWAGIGTTGTHFQGKFNGNGYTISNLNINGQRADGSRQGLFMILGTNALVKNLTVKGANIWSESAPVRGSGAIAKENNGKIYCVMVVDCTIQLGNWDNLGGLVGKNNSSGVIENCGVVNTLLRYRWGGAGKHSIGGLTAFNYGTIKDSYTYCCTIANGNEQINPLCPIGNEPINCYYYTESADNKTWENKAFDKDKFNKGYVTYFGLNQTNTTNPIWRQNVDAENPDLYPLPFESHAIVYLYSSDSKETYTNSPMISSGLTLMLGDANLNGRVDKEDEALLKQYLSGANSMSKNGLISCDINKDGKVDKSDLKSLSAYIKDGALSIDFIIGKITELDSMLPESGTLVGDINRDGAVDKKDLELFKDFLDGKIKLEGAEKLAANVDLSDGFDALDLQIIREYLDNLAEERKLSGHIGKYVFTGEKDIPSPGDNSASNWMILFISLFSVVCLFSLVSKKRVFR